MTIDLKMPPPDWGRYRVAPSKIAPVGDPTKWGAQEFTSVAAPAPGETTFVYTKQILNAGTRDGYPRPWSLIGTLSLPNPIWTSDFAGVYLEVMLGTGQIQMTHTISLFLRMDYGLCVTQHGINGPYYGNFGEQINNYPFGTVGGVDEVRPFAAIGALVGQTIGVRAIYSLDAGAPNPITPWISRLQLMVTPYAAGEEL